MWSEKTSSVPLGPPERKCRIVGVRQAKTRSPILFFLPPPPPPSLLQLLLARIYVKRTHRDLSLPSPPSHSSKKNDGQIAGEASLGSDSASRWAQEWNVRPHCRAWAPGSAFCFLFSFRQKIFTRRVVGAGPECDGSQRDTKPAFHRG